MKGRSAALVSFKPGVGKSTSAVFLAFALQQLGRRVLLVDADPGKSVLRWADDAARHFDPFPFDVASPSSKDPRGLDRLLFSRANAGTWDWLVIDVPQLEDHAEIGRVSMRHADSWLMPMAPAPIEFDRALRARVLMDEIQDELSGKGLDYQRPRFALLNRCNRRNPSVRGPDTQFRKHLTDLGFVVFHEQVESCDDRYRQVFGVSPLDAESTPYAGIAKQLEATR